MKREEVFVYSNPKTIPDNVQITSQKTFTSAQSIKKKTIGPNWKWKKRDVETYLPEYSAPMGVVEEYFAEFATPTDIFLALITDILDKIVYQSNLHTTRRDKI